MLGGFYIIVILIYIFFEFVVVNYRPIILYKNPEASYPSSHTMIVICITLTAIRNFNYYFKRYAKNYKPLLIIFNGLSALIAVVTVVGRLVSGVHWFTDIVGGLILSFALVGFYDFCVHFFTKSPDSVLDKSE